MALRDTEYKTPIHYNISAFFWKWESSINIRTEFGEPVQMKAESRGVYACMKGEKLLMSEAASSLETRIAAQKNVLCIDFFADVGL